jgi:hypothetical protein
VRDVAQDFAQAYQDEDGTALRRLLTPGVARVLPSGVARGRARVVREYESQFRAQETEGYSLDDLAIQGGRAGRASGSYKVDRKDKQPIEGRIVLGMVRDRGQPRIGLIAVTPNRLTQQERATSSLTVEPRRTCLPGAGDWSQTWMPRGTSGSRKPPPRSALSLRSRSIGLLLRVVERRGRRARARRRARRA